MNKKLIALLLAAVMVIACFALAACGNKTDDTATTDAANTSDAPAAESDLAYIQSKGKLVVGITDFAPMDFKEEGSEEWVGFDADLAKAFANSLGVEVEFTEIDWDNKILELDGKSIDCVWNGMTITDEVKSAMSVSDPYCKNAQVIVVPADIQQRTVSQCNQKLQIRPAEISAGNDQVNVVQSARLITFVIVSGFFICHDQHFHLPASFLDGSTP